MVIFHRKRIEKYPVEYLQWRWINSALSQSWKTDVVSPAHSHSLTHFNISLIWKWHSSSTTAPPAGLVWDCTCPVACVHLTHINMNNLVSSLAC